ncbi:hypothetical protein H2201_001527 [Coniosporium apollinis]|uniref:Major facilitator superfamily (MFS) profile domain-containing protein n=1 Tax=Coniosporium apollinis TaxID=61459 RepID=A0ABQ9P4K2_9PEZI|nr:hypothetical protein H2201_001527 [Coniosporium apollinis]
MKYFVNPFKKHDISEFPGVLMPLSQAPHRASFASVPDAKSEDNKAPSFSGNLILESLKAEIEHDIAAGDFNSAYGRTKVQGYQQGIQDIGMGRYQYELFVLCGFDWLADNLWLQGIALTLPSLSEEFGIDSNTIRYTTLSLFLGLCIGASFWGVASDVIGRCPAFNFTLLLAGVFGIAAGGAPNWIGTCAMYACLGLALAAICPSMVHFAWGFTPNYPVNWGWRYLVFAMGAFTMAMFVCRFFVFHLFESPKFLLSRGPQSEAVAAVHGIAYHNKAKTWLTEDILNEIGGNPDVVGKQALSTMEIVKRTLSKFSGQRIAPLFHGWRLAVKTVLLWFIWTTIGMGYPLFNSFLPQYLANAGSDQGPTPTNIVYRNYAITSVGTMAISTVISGVFLYLFTTSTNSDVQLAFSSLEAFFQNIMYGVLYAYTPEVFPAPNRGTGTGISSFLNRIAGLWYAYRRDLCRGSESRGTDICVWRSVLRGFYRYVGFAH